VETDVVSGIAILICVFVLYALVASRLERLSITAPMIFVAAGVVLGRSVTGQLHVTLTSESILVVVELTLALLLFADASTVRLREVEGDARLPGRLLLVGLPLTIALGTVVARLLFPAAGWAAAALIGSILAPTDSALGLAIFTNRAVPVRIRRALNVESGLNDGIVTPFVTLFLTLIVSGNTSSRWVIEAGKEIGLALVVAIGVGVMGGMLLRSAHRRGFTSEVSE
jgi:sodium/hydrogen antiporter